MSIDFQASDAPQRFARSLHETGFAVLENHPIDVAAIDTMYREWRKFFARDGKLGFATDGATMHGYYGFKSENAKGNRYKDLKEFFHVYEGAPVPAAAASVTRSFHRALLDLGVVLLRWLDAQSPAAVRAALTEPLASMVRGSAQNLLRIVHYPPLDGRAQPGEQRAAPHEDINLITLLVAGTQPGLQARDKRGHWHTVPCHPGMITVNVGDMLALASGGYYPATTHRVVNPEPSVNRSRYSMPLFVHPRPEVELASNQTARQFLEQRLREIGLK